MSDLLNNLHPVMQQAIAPFMAAGAESKCPTLTASKLMQFSDGHEFEANLSIHHQVGACLTLTDGFGNEVEVVSEDNIEALIKTCEAALLRSRSARTVAQRVAA